MQKNNSLLAWIVTVILLLLVFVLINPSLVQNILPAGSPTLSMHTPFAQLVAFPGITGAVAGGLCVVFLIWALIRRRRDYPAGIPGFVALALLALALWQFGGIISKGVMSSQSIGEDAGISAANPGNSTYRLLEYNTGAGKTDAAHLTDTIVQNGVDIVALSEFSLSRGQDLQKRLAERGIEFSLFHNGASKYEAEYFSNVILVGKWLGNYQASVLDEQAYVKSLKAMPDDNKQPVILGVHVPRPVNQLWENWKNELDGVTNWCKETPNAVVVGDFNATLAHGPMTNLSPCVDATSKVGTGGISTWPSDYPSLLGTTIDHVLLHTQTWKPVRSATVQVGESDHRGIILEFMRAQ